MKTLRIRSFVYDCYLHWVWNLLCWWSIVLWVFRYYTFRCRFGPCVVYRANQPNIIFYSQLESYKLQFLDVNYSIPTQILFHIAHPTLWLYFCLYMNVYIRSYCSRKPVPSVCTSQLNKIKSSPIKLLKKAVLTCSSQAVEVYSTHDLLNP